MLRYAFASHLVQAGADLRHVQEMLGHARASTTQLYTRLSALEVAREHRRTHPRARKTHRGSPS
ncbi:MAG: tyrosine-type recombinase/integrase [Vulcanimicrobiota bacterium]